MNRLGGLCVPCVLSVIASAAGAMQTAPYDVLDNVEGEWVSTGAVPVRPMVLTADGQDIYAVSTQASTVVHIGPTAITTAFATPRSPVALALWDHDTQDAVPESRLVVACRDSWVLALLDRLTGEVVGLLELRHPTTGRILGEPQDLLVDQAANRAFVSCAAADAVAEVDLTTLAVTRLFELPAKNPVFMTFDSNDDVLVAPLLSGNNSGARRAPNTLFNPQHQGPTVVDFLALGLNGTRLPDEDLFRCVRSTGAVEAVTRDAGTIQFACGVHPTTGQVWQLNTEALNKDPARQGIDAIQGDFIRNRLSISNLPAIGQPANAPTKIVNLDTTNGGFPYDPSRNVGQPYALMFVGDLGVVTGLLTDNVMVLDSAGDYLVEFDLPAGSIPRGLLYLPAQARTFVYCWGTNKIEAFSTNLNPQPLFTIDLGFDPTPEKVKQGREIFYDAANSAKNNLSCASCHVEARTDMTIWNLSSIPTDDKGPLLTQSLAGIERVAPFQWRGEQRRGLDDFNDAFVQLHGAAQPLSEADFDKFRTFLFSIQSAPNPYENESRVLDDSIQPPLLAGAPAARATLGKALFQGECETCHNLPTGSNNGIIDAGGTGFGEQNPRRQRFKTAPFHAIYRREQDADRTTAGVQPVSITLASLTGGADEQSFYSVLGASHSHTGLTPGLHAFVSIFPFTSQQRTDVAGFIYQWDQGLAPTTYRAVLLDQASFASASTTLQNELVPQADLGHCDLAVFGKSRIGGVTKPMRWLYDRSIARFVAEDSTVLDQTLANLLTQAQNGVGSNVFLGLPVGMGRRFAIDYDGDDLFNADETSLTLGWNTDPLDPDTDGDTWPDGHEALNGGNPTSFATVSNDTTDPVIYRAVTQMVTGRVARINLETSEPCVVTVDYSRVAGPLQTTSTTEFATTHSVLLNDLRPSTGGAPWLTYSGTVTVTDLAGRTASVGLPSMPAYNFALPGTAPGPITTRSFANSPDDVIVGELRWAHQGRNVGRRGRTATASVRVDQMIGGPPNIPGEGLHVVARLFRNGTLATDFDATRGSSKLAGFDWLSGGTPAAFTGFAGPFLVSERTDASGHTELSFNLHDFQPGDEVLLNVELVVERDGAFPTFTAKDLVRYVMPQTKARNRALILK